MILPSLQIEKFFLSVCSENIIVILSHFLQQWQRNKKDLILLKSELNPSSQQLSNFCGIIQLLLKNVVNCRKLLFLKIIETMK